MPKLVINYGSINIDHIYHVPHFVQPGETLTSSSISTGLGGKGANQSVAIARAGGQVLHIGQVGKRDAWALDELNAAGVNTNSIRTIDGPSGHAIIQVDEDAENAILIHGGANQQGQPQCVQAALRANPDVGFVLLQNECNAISEVVDLALQEGAKVVLNPAPMTASIKQLPLHRLDTLVVNQGEALALSGASTTQDTEDYFRQHFPETRIVLTWGKSGATLLYQEKRFHQPAFNVDAVDTTGAGDTFVGYLLACLAEKPNPTIALQYATAAAALAVQKAGAIAAIPSLTEVRDFLNAQNNY